MQKVSLKISIDDQEYGLRPLKRRVERLKQRLERLNKIEALSVHGAEDLGRVKEAIYIYEDLIDMWEKLPVSDDSSVETFEKMKEENTTLTEAEKNDAEERLIKNQDVLNNELYEDKNISDEADW